MVCSQLPVDGPQLDGGRGGGGLLAPHVLPAAERAPGARGDACGGGGVRRAVRVPGVCGREAGRGPAAQRQPQRHQQRAHARRVRVGHLPALGQLHGEEHRGVLRGGGRDCLYLTLQIYLFLRGPPVGPAAELRGP